MWLKKVFIKNGFAKLGFKQQVRQMDNNLRKFQHSASGIFFSLRPLASAECENAASVIH